MQQLHTAGPQYHIPHRGGLHPLGLPVHCPLAPSNPACVSTKGGPAAQQPPPAHNLGCGQGKQKREQYLGRLSPVARGASTAEVGVSQLEQGLQVALLSGPLPQQHCQPSTARALIPAAALDK